MKFLQKVVVKAAPHRRKVINLDKDGNLEIIEPQGNQNIVIVPKDSEEKNKALDDLLI